MSEKRARQTKSEIVIVGEEKTRVGALSGDTSDTVFLWVGRKDDDDTEERVTILTAAQAERFARFVLTLTERTKERK